MLTTKKLVVVIISGLALASWSDRASAQELMVNGGFELGDYTNWRALGVSGATPTITSTPSEVYEGSYAAVLTKTDTSDFIILDNFGVEAPVAYGQTLQLSYAAKQLAGDANSALEVAIRTYTTDYGAPVEPVSIVPAWTPTAPDSSGFTTYSYNYTVTGGAKKLYFAWRMPTDGPLGTYAVDAVSATVVDTQPEKNFNGGFETGDFSGWRSVAVSGTAPTITNVPAEVNEGSYAAVLTKTNSSDYVVLDNFTTEAVVVPGHRLQLSYDVKRLAGDSNSQLEAAIIVRGDGASWNVQMNSVYDGIWSVTTPGTDYETVNFDIVIPDDEFQYDELYIAWRMPDSSTVLGTYSIDNVSALSAPVTADLDGDYNDDDAVNAADYVLWRKTVGQPLGALANDSTGVNSIGDAQYNQWRTNFGNPSSGRAAAVPEPTAIVVVY